MFVDWLSSVCSVNTSERLKMWMYYGMESKMSSKLFKYCPRAHEHTQLGPCTCKTLIILFKKLFQVCTYSMFFFFSRRHILLAKKKGGRAYEQVCVLLYDSFCSHGFIPFTPEMSWKIGAAEHPHRLTHSHTRSHTHTITHFGLESAVAIIPGPVPFGRPWLHKNI